MNQQEYQQLMSEINYYQDLLNQIESSLKNLNKARQDLQDFEKEDSKDILAPITNGVYVEAELKNKKLLVNVGANVVSAKSVSQAVSILENQEKEVLKDKDKVVEKIESCYEMLEKNNNGA